MPLTNTAIHNAKPRKKPVKLLDERGCISRSLRPAGWWRLKYRFGGREKRLSLGVYPDVSLKDARERRDASRKMRWPQDVASAILLATCAAPSPRSREALRGDDGTEIPCRNPASDGRL